MLYGRYITQCYLLALLILPSLSVGQSNNEYFFDHITIEQGLSHNSVNSIIQDRYGYIWIGTDSGLNKFDGVTLTNITESQSIDDPDHYIGLMITALFEDSEGGMWAGSRNHGLSYKDPKSSVFMSFYNHPELSKIVGSEVYSIYQDQESNIWICTIGAGLFKFNQQTQEVYTFSTINNSITSNNVFDIVQSDRGDYFAVCDLNGLLYKAKNSDGFKKLSIQSLEQIQGYRKRISLNKDKLWIASEGSGIHQYNLNNSDLTSYTSTSVTSPISSNNVRDIIVEDNKVIFATDGYGLGTIYLDSGIVTSQRASQSFDNDLNSDALLCLLKDDHGILWIGTFNGGVNIYDKSKTRFDHFSGSLITKTLPSRSVLAIHETTLGDVIFGTDGGGIGMIDGSSESIQKTAFGDKLNSSIIKCFLSDNLDNVLWVGTFGAGLKKVNLLTNQVDNYDYGENSLSNSSIWSIAQRQNGDLWIGTLGGGINILSHEDNTFSYYDHISIDSNSLSEQVVLSIIVTDEDVPWIGTTSKGINVYDEPNDRFIRLSHSKSDSQSITNNNIRALFQDSRGIIWVGTDGGGLNRHLGDYKFKSYNNADGLLSNSVMAIEEDEEGYLWISTLKGISRINAKTEEIINFEFDEREMNQFNQQSSLLSSGKLFFGGINGIHTVNTDQVISSNTDFSIAFTKLFVLNKEILPNVEYEGSVILEQSLEESQEIVLSHRSKAITFHFTSFDFVGKSSEPYYYYLEGFNDVWQPLEKDAHSITYTNLDPGKYLLKIKRGNALSEMKLSISPPFWETWWFRALIFLLSLLLMKVVYDMLQKREKERHEKELLDAESKILTLKNEKLETEIDANNSKLLFSTTQMAHKNTILIGVKSELEKIQEEKKISLRKTIRVLESELQSGDYWNEFNIYFDKIDKNLLNTLVNEYPKLTKNDLRLCGLLKLNLNTKEIASLLNISLRGVEKAKYRLKKKLELTSEINLDNFIQLYSVRK